MMNGDKAFAIMVGDRFFYSLKKNRLHTAWSLPGAQLYGEWSRQDGTVQKIVDKLREKGYSPKVVEVGLGDEVAPF